MMSTRAQAILESLPDLADVAAAQSKTLSHHQAPRPVRSAWRACDASPLFGCFNRRAELLRGPDIGASQELGPPKTKRWRAIGEPHPTSRSVWSAPIYPVR